MDVISITTAGYGGRVCFLDEYSLAYATGHGVVAHDTTAGIQRHIWTLTEGIGLPTPNVAPAVLAACPGAQLLAYVQAGDKGQAVQVVSGESLQPASTIKDFTNKHLEFATLAFNADGTRLLTIGGLPDNQLDVWDVDSKDSLIRVPLPDSLGPGMPLAGGLAPGSAPIDPAFFPINSDVFAVAGPAAARVIWAEPMCGSYVVRQSEVELSLLAEGERLTSLAWTPNGTLLLGTSAGRLLGVRGAAPPAVPVTGWGVQPSGGHVAELLYGPPSPPPPAVTLPPPLAMMLAPPAALHSAVTVAAGPAPPRTGVAAVVVTAAHVLLVLAGDANTSAQLLWLSPNDLRPVGSAVLPLRSIVRAVPSPSFASLAIASGDGSLCLASTSCPSPGTGTATGHLTRSSNSTLGTLRTSGTGLISGPDPTLPPSPFALGTSGTGANSPSHLPHSRSGSKTGMGAALLQGGDGSGYASKGAPVQVMEIARFHRGRISASLWLSASRLVTGGGDGTVRMWSYIASDMDPPDEAMYGSPALVLEAMWHVGQPVTCMAALQAPSPPSHTAAAPASALTDGSGQAPGSPERDGAGPRRPSLPPAFLLGTAGGVVQLVNADQVPTNAADAADLNQLAKSLASTWDVRLFDGPVTAAAFSPEGQYCAVSCAPEGRIAFLRVMVLGHQLSMRLLGFYAIREPKHLAWAPPEPGTLHPLLVVGSLLGEIVVLNLPDASASEAVPADGTLPRGSLVRATLRAASHVTALAVHPCPGADKDGKGHFWVFTAHTDKSIRRYRMCSEQHKAAGALAARAAAAVAAAETDVPSPHRTGGGAAPATLGRLTSMAPGAQGGVGLGRLMSMAPGSPGGLHRNQTMMPSGAGQAFQLPESEKPMELQLVATCLSISALEPPPQQGGGGALGGPGGAGLRMALAAADGSVAVYSLPEIALQGRWLLHEMTSGGATAVCLLGDRVLSGGGEGSVQVLELGSAVARARHGPGGRASHVGGLNASLLSGPSRTLPLGSRGSITAGPGNSLLASGPSRAGTGMGGTMNGGLGGGAGQRSTFFASTGPPRPRTLERAILGCVAPLHLAPAPLPGIHTAAEGAPTWQQAKTQGVQQLHRDQLASFRAKVTAKCRQWAEKIQELKEINAAADEVERLTPEEFVIDTTLRRQLVAAGEQRYAAVKEVVAKEMKVMQVVRERIRERCLGSMECMSRPLLPLGEYTFISPMDPTEARKYRFDGEAAAARTAADGGVWSYGLRKLSAEQQKRLKQVSFLRRVEQGEAAHLHPQERGGVVPLRRYAGDMQRRFTITSDGEVAPANAAQAMQPPSGTAPGPQHGPDPQAAAQSQGGGGGGWDDYNDGYTEGYDTGYGDDAGTGTGSGAPQRSRSQTRRFGDAAGYEGCEVGYGETGLLYADAQLYTHCRRAAQIVLIQEEVRALQRSFNAKWEQVRANKQKALDRIDERLGRIVEIHKDLTKLAAEAEDVAAAASPAATSGPGAGGVGAAGAGTAASGPAPGTAPAPPFEPPPPAPDHVPGGFYAWRPEEEMEALAEVRDEEVTAPKYVSPEELSRRAALAAAEDEARRKAEADDARNRALKEMMNNNPQATRTSKAGKNRLVREAWMDLPAGQMNKDQRQKLIEWERKRSELAEELEKQRRLLEAERRALEVDIADTAAGVNVDLTRLANAKVRMDMEVVHQERRALDTAAVVTALAASEAVRSALGKQLGALTARRARRTGLVQALDAKVAAATRAYDDVSLSEKQVDKAFRREFSSRPELWDDAQKVYRDRTFLLASGSSTDSAPAANGASPTGNGHPPGAHAGAKLPRKSALDLLGKSPEGAALAAALEAGGVGRDPGLSRSASVSSTRQASIARIGSRRPGAEALSGVGAISSIGGHGLPSLVGGMSGLPGGGGGGPALPDVLLTTPRSVVADMALLARPPPRPGSPLQDFAARHQAQRPASPLEDGPRGIAASLSMRRHRSLPRSMTRQGIHVGVAWADDTTAGGDGGTGSGSASGAAGSGGGGGGAGTGRGIVTRPPGLRLRALQEKAGRALDPMLQMVADGLSASALVRDLGLLGVIPAAALGDLDPYRVDAVRRVFDPFLTGAAEALAGLHSGGTEGGGGGTGGGGLTSTGNTADGGVPAAAGLAGVSFTGSISGRRSLSVRSTTQGGGLGLNKEASNEPADEDPLLSRERPEGMDDASWIRLLEFRNTRVDLEKEAEDTWRVASLLAAQLDWLEMEDAEMEAQLEEAGARAAALRDAAARLALDVSLTYRLRNGQVELPERPGDVVAAGDVLAGAVILHRSRIETLNEEVLDRGEGKIELLETLRGTRRKINLALWEVQAGDMAGTHAAQRLTELQLLHVTKDLQAALRDPAIVDRLADEARLAILMQSSANLHGHRLELRQRQWAGLGSRVARGGAEAGELAIAEAAAEGAYQESSRMHTMMSSAQAAEDAAQRRHMRNIVTNAQLRAIAQQQGEELERLAAELSTTHARNFPALAPPTAWAPPDARAPLPPPSRRGGRVSGQVSIMGSRGVSRGSVGGAGLGATTPTRAGGMGRFGSGAGPGPGPGPGPAGPGGSRPASGLPLPGVQKRPASNPRSSSGGGSGPLYPSRPGSGVVHSGGAGAGLSRAYAAGAGGVPGSPGSMGSRPGTSQSSRNTRRG
ncbi:hypothetical protein HYH03_017030 [Edaphochlamys debaryana]|uniref:Cilia- and flagella-associated protein 43 n=1 Tax=Edaphochlamys debaryana TaxID=47281 RepID=A0A836BQV4_9CHLO|nr:hypothetical protein HYH03_017030 [Edaphochlamys debaryana]|eukprot:KAG2484149.1 hypothetical protein HYH03_017030 [Edaphochlamys debaryana]